MQGTRLQALLALRKSCAELKPHVQAPLTA